MCVCMYTHTHSHTHTYIYIYIYIYRHTLVIPLISLFFLFFVSLFKLLKNAIYSFFYQDFIPYIQTQRYIIFFRFTKITPAFKKRKDVYRMYTEYLHIKRNETKKQWINERYFEVHSINKGQSIYFSTVGEHL